MKFACGIYILHPPERRRKQCFFIKNEAHWPGELCACTPCWWVVFFWPPCDGFVSLNSHFFMLLLCKCSILPFLGGFLLKCFTLPTIYKPLCFYSMNHLYVNLKVSVPADIISVLYPHQGSLKDPFKIFLPPEVRENIFLKLTV